MHARQFSLRFSSLLLSVRATYMIDVNIAYVYLRIVWLHRPCTPTNAPHETNLIHVSLFIVFFSHFSTMGLLGVVMCQHVSSCATHFDSARCRAPYCTLPCLPVCCPAIYYWASSFFSFSAHSRLFLRKVAIGSI